jgi:hypothetical protein
MTSLSRVSRRKRSEAAAQWSTWRNQGIGSELTAAQAYDLTGLPYLQDMQPERPVRLTEIAIEYTLSKG